ncbi:MAG: AAA family ATPase [Bacillota bacterium]
MWVESIELKNIKSYENLKINLERGVNFISGINGAGKTTLLECIGLALFNCTREKRYAEHFVRNGEKEGVIGVTFHVNGACYKVERRVSLNSSRNSWKAFDMSAGGMQLRLSGESDMEAWLKECMGIFAHFTLSRMFNDVIGVSQGMFTAPFLLPEARRKEHFNAILQVEHYKKSAEKSRPVADHINKEIFFIKGQLQTLEGAQETLEQMLEDGKALEAEALAKREAQEMQKKKLDAAKKELLLVQEKARAIDENRNEAALAEKIWKAAGERLEERKAELEHAQKAVERLRELEPGYLEYEKTARELGQIEEQEKEQRRLETEKRWAQEIHSALKDEMRARQTWETKEARRASLVGKEDEIKKREQAHTQVQADYKWLQEISGKIKKGFEMLRERQESIQKHEAGLSAFPALREREAMLSGVLARRDEAIKEQAALKTRIEQLKRDMERAGGGACPIMDKKCPLVGTDLQEYLTSMEAGLLKQLVIQTKKVEALEDSAKEQEEVRNAIIVLEETDKRLTGELDMRAKIIARINERLDELRFSKALEELQTHIEDVRLNVPEAVDELSDTDEPLRSIESYMTAVQRRMEATQDALQKERVAFTGQLGAATAEARAAKQALEDTEKKLEALKDKDSSGALALPQDKEGMLAALAQEIEECDRKLREFTSLEERGNAVRARKEERRSVYEQYIENKRFAQAFEQSEANVSKAAEEVLQSKERLDACREKGRMLAEGWDDALRERMQARVDELSRDFFAGQSRLEATDEKLEKHRQELDRQREKVGQVKALQIKEAQLQKALELLNIICGKVLKRMGERVSRVYRSRLSTRATQLYTQVARQNVELCWGEDYDIELIDMLSGTQRTRTFRQLSGGEQMTAALAVRLGLLSQLSEVSMVCFDEPTTNLDRQRRENLSEIIPRLTKNFEQVLVISHDDTFDSITHHTVRLVREHPQPTALLDLQDV